MQNIQEISRPASIRQVAELSGVSISTVSKAFNNSTQIGKGTAQKVFVVAEKLGYKPDSRARSLRSGKHWNIGILSSVVYIDPGFSETILSHLIYWITAEKYGVSFEHLNIDGDNKLLCPELVAANRVDGLVIVGHIDGEYLQQVSEWGLPVCLLDNFFDHPNFCSVSVDNKSGSREAVQYLAALGHKAIGYIHGTLKWPNAKARYDGYMETISELNLPFKQEYIIRTDDQQQNYRGGHRATLKLLSQSPEISAIVYVNEWYAVGGLAAVNLLGKKVPQDISIVSFGNSYLTQETEPALTTISGELESLCHIGALNLIRKVENKMVNPEMSVRPKLIRSDSCAAPKLNSKQ